MGGWKYVKMTKKMKPPPSCCNIWSRYNWVVVHPIYTLTNQGPSLSFFFANQKKTTGRQKFSKLWWVVVVSRNLLGVSKGEMIQFDYMIFWSTTLTETNSSHLPACAIPRRNDRLPTIHLQVLLLMVQKSQTTTWDVKDLANNGTNYQPQLVSRVSNHLRWCTGFEFSDWSHRNLRGKNSPPMPRFPLGNSRVLVVDKSRDDDG